MLRITSKNYLVTRQHERLTLQQTPACDTRTSLALINLLRHISSVAVESEVVFSGTKTKYRNMISAEHERRTQPFKTAVSSKVVHSSHYVTTTWSAMRTLQLNFLCIKLQLKIVISSYFFLQGFRENILLQKRFHSSQEYRNQCSKTSCSSTSSMKQVMDPQPTVVCSQISAIFMSVN
jgi:hypothetical protein